MPVPTFPPTGRKGHLRLPFQSNLAANSQRVSITAVIGGVPDQCVIQRWHAKERNLRNLSKMGDKEQCEHSTDETALLVLERLFFVLGYDHRFNE